MAAKGLGRVLQLDAWVRLCWPVVAKLDDGERLQHCAGQTFGTTLARTAALSAAGTIAFGVAVGSDGAGSYDDQEQHCNETRNPVQNVHCNGRVRATRTRARGRYSIANCRFGHADAGVGNSERVFCLARVNHGEDSLIQQICVAQVTAIAGLAVEQNGSRQIVSQCVKDAVGVDKRVRYAVTAEIGDLVWS